MRETGSHRGRGKQIRRPASLNVHGCTRHTMVVQPWGNSEATCVLSLFLPAFRGRALLGMYHWDTCTCLTPYGLIVLKACHKNCYPSLLALDPLVSLNGQEESQRLHGISWVEGRHQAPCFVTLYIHVQVVPRAAWKSGQGWDVVVQHLIDWSIPLTNGQSWGGCV